MLFTCSLSLSHTHTHTRAHTHTHTHTHIHIQTHTLSLSLPLSLSLSPALSLSLSISLPSIAPDREQWLGRCVSRTTAVERRGNHLKVLKDFYLKAKARIWHRLAYMCHIRSATAAAVLKDFYLKFSSGERSFGISDQGESRKLTSVGTHFMGKTLLKLFPSHSVDAILRGRSTPVSSTQSKSFFQIALICTARRWNPARASPS